VRAVAAEGMQFTAHAVGDGAVALLLDAYREVDRERPLADLRPCLTHSNFMSPESIADAARMGVVVDLQPVWLHLDGDTLLRHFGDERMRRFQPLRMLFDNGVVVGGGSDHMQKIGRLRSVNPYSPFLGMWTAVSRQARRIGADHWPAEGGRFVAGRSFRSVHPEHAISREEAIRMYTIDNAKVLLCERDVGSLEPGKRADFVILDRDLLACPIDDIPDTQVLETWLEGRRLAVGP